MGHACYTRIEALIVRFCRDGVVGLVGKLGIWWLKFSGELEWRLERRAEGVSGESLSIELEICQDLIFLKVD